MTEEVQDDILIFVRLDMKSAIDQFKQANNFVGEKISREMSGALCTLMANCYADELDNLGVVSASAGFTSQEIFDQFPDQLPVKNIRSDHCKSDMFNELAKVVFGIDLMAIFKSFATKHLYDIMKDKKYEVVAYAVCDDVDQRNYEKALSSMSVNFAYVRCIRNHLC